MNDPPRTPKKKRKTRTDLRQLQAQRQGSISDLLEEPELSDIELDNPYQHIERQSSTTEHPHTAPTFTTASRSMAGKGQEVPSTQGLPDTASSSSTPRPTTHTTQFLTISPAQLDALVTQIATTAVRAQQTQTGPGQSSKGLKIAEPSPFSGKPEDLKPLLRECELRFNLQQDIYDTANKKAYFVLALFKTGMPKVWKEQYIRSREGYNLVQDDDWTQFKNLLKSGFPKLGQTQDAMQELQKIRQGKTSVDKLNTKFRLLIQKAGLNATTNASMLIQLYEQAISREIVRQIIISGSPDNLDEWMRKASELDNAFRRANRLFASAITKQPYRGFKPRFNHSFQKRESQGEPMDIDRLHPKEQE